MPVALDFRETYTEDLFKGWIDSVEAARRIIRALRLDHTPPQALSAGADGKLQCDLIG